MTVFTNDGRRALQAVLDRHGIDPNTVAEEGLGYYGYNEFILDPDGSKVLDASGRSMKEPHGWPQAVLADPEFNDAMSAAIDHIARVNSMALKLNAFTPGESVIAGDTRATFVRALADRTVVISVGMDTRVVDAVIVRKAES